MTTHDFEKLLSAYQQHLATQPLLSLTPRSHLDSRFGARTLSARDRLLVTVITHRWSTHRVALASIMGVNHTTVARAIRETNLDLTNLGKTIPPAPMKATTTNELLALIGQDPTAH